MVGRYDIPIGARSIPVWTTERVGSKMKTAKQVNTFMPSEPKPIFEHLREAEWNPTFRWTGIVEEAADRINVWHEDYPLRVPATLEEIESLVGAPYDSAGEIPTNPSTEGLYHIVQLQKESLEVGHED
ncbi:hypothetical protein CMI37_28720 [Candidatus Pacearchaeota archaeon]|nr:hypothetical protein [Candidatus Pacearchaeota archaeon]|tara:strand:+ start:1229 stop:1612 length:384 start_codon:yes stop_codon:yes gene_type:complete